MKPKVPGTEVVVLRGVQIAEALRAGRGGAVELHAPGVRSSGILQLADGHVGVRLTAPVEGALTSGDAVEVRYAGAKFAYAAFCAVEALDEPELRLAWPLEVHRRDRRRFHRELGSSARVQLASGARVRVVDASVNGAAIGVPASIAASPGDRLAMSVTLSADQPTPLTFEVRQSEPGAPGEAVLRGRFLAPEADGELAEVRGELGALFDDMARLHAEGRLTPGPAPHRPPDSTHEEKS